MYQNGIDQHCVVPHVSQPNLLLIRKLNLRNDLRDDRIRQCLCRPALLKRLVESTTGQEYGCVRRHLRYSSNICKLVDLQKQSIKENRSTDVPNTPRVKLANGGSRSGMPDNGETLAYKQGKRLTHKQRHSRISETQPLNASSTAVPI